MTFKYATPRNAVLIEFLNNAFDLEEPLQPPNLETTIGHKDKKLEDAPPLDSAVGALSGVPVRPLSHKNVALLILDLIDQFSHGTYWKASAIGSAHEAEGD